MIFITTGTQEPFDRLLRIVALVAEEINEEIVIQAKTTLSFPKNVTVKEFISPKEFDSYFLSANFIISHAGMGTIISALEKNKPLIIFPRIASLGEHRNEHQMATANKMRELKLVDVAVNEVELSSMLNMYLAGNNTTISKKIGHYASATLLVSLEEFIES